MAFLTNEASQAIEWLRQRMPDGIFDMFQEELEAAITPVMERFGFDGELKDAFSVKKLVADREPLIIDAEEGAQSFRADIYSGNGTYAVTRHGEIYRRGKRGEWCKSRLTLADVIAKSITKVSGTITIKADE